MASNRTLGLFTPAKAPERAPQKEQLADVKKFSAMLGTSNATMTILGDVDAATIRPWIEKTWGSWKSPRPWQRIERKYTATTGGEQLLDFPDKANTMIVAVANYTLGGSGFVSRLVTRLRQRDGLSYFAFSQLQLFPFDAAGGFTAGGGLNPENARKGMAALLEEITNLVSSGITAGELAGAKQGLLSGFERNLSSDPFVLGILQDGLYLDRTMEFWARRNAAIGALTVDQVNTVIRRRIQPGSLVKITAGDDKKM